MIELRWKKLPEFPLPDTACPIVTVDGWPAVLQYRESDMPLAEVGREGVAPVWSDWTDVEVAEE